MKKNIVDFINEYNIISGIVLLAIGIGLFLYLLFRDEESLNFKGSNILKWDADIYT